MNLRIFDISEGLVTINENALLIPELKAIVNHYEDPIPPLCYVYYMTDPFSPYANLTEEDKEEMILQDYDGDYTSDDELIYQAIDKLNKLYETPRSRLHKNAKIALETLGNYLGKAMIRDEDKTGNFATFRAALKDIARISKEFDDLDKQVEEELKIRGNNNLGYDEL